MVFPWAVHIFISFRSSFLMGKRELIAFLNLSSWCLVMFERLFLAVQRGCLQIILTYFFCDIVVQSKAFVKGFGFKRLFRSMFLIIFIKSCFTVVLCSRQKACYIRKS